MLVVSVTVATTVSGVAGKVKVLAGNVDVIVLDKTMVDVTVSAGSVVVSAIAV